MSTESDKTESTKDEKEGNLGSELVKAVAKPLYDDALSGASKEVGKALTLIGRAINVALLPLKGTVWGFERIEKHLKDALEKKLAEVPPGRVIAPPANIAVPAIEAMRYLGNDEILSDMFANLLASAMDGTNVSQPHPAFVEIIKQLHPKEAVFLRALTPSKRNLLRFKMDMTRWKSRASGVYDNQPRLEIGSGDPWSPSLSPLLLYSALDNLARLKIIEDPESRVFTHSLQLIDRRVVLNSGVVPEERELLAPIYEKVPDFLDSSREKWSEQITSLSLETKVQFTEFTEFGHSFFCHAIDRDIEAPFAASEIFDW